MEVEEEEELEEEGDSLAGASNSPFPKELGNLPPLSSLRKVGKKATSYAGFVRKETHLYTHLVSLLAYLTTVAIMPSSCSLQDGAVSAGVRYSVVNALYAYAFVVRRFHGKQADLPLEASEVGGNLHPSGGVYIASCLFLSYGLLCVLVPLPSLPPLSPHLSSRQSSPSPPPCPLLWLRSHRWGRPCDTPWLPFGR